MRVVLWVIVCMACAVCAAAAGAPVSVSESGTSAATTRGPPVDDDQYVEYFWDTPPLKDGDDPTYDHQTATYHASHKPVHVAGKDVAMRLFFSPDHSIGELTRLVESAEKRLDVATPGFSSWSGCTNWNTDPHPGCKVAYQRNSELFPIFNALLNAIHRGVRVRILTNDYDQEPAEGLINPLIFLQLAGAEVRYYTSTTFMHAKYIRADGTLSISSVNFSYTSFMKNREAGVVIAQSASTQPLFDFCDGVFDADFAQGNTPTPPSYSDADMAIIKDTSAVPVHVPEPVDNPYSYKTKVYDIKEDMDITLYTSPDYSFDTLTTLLNSTLDTAAIMIYQITDPRLCDIVKQFGQNRDIDLTLLVSGYIFDTADWEAATKCYKDLYDAGITVRKTNSHFTFSHQKFWLIDRKVAGLSTGNWSPTDFPGVDTLPPHGQPGWQRANRDFELHITGSEKVLEVFSTVLSEDFQRGYNFRPDSDGAQQ